MSMGVWEWREEKEEMDEKEPRKGGIIAKALEVRLGIEKLEKRNRKTDGDVRV